MYTELEAGGRTYKLRLTTQGAVKIEQKIGYNPLQMFMGIDEDVLPKVGDMIAVLHQMLQSLDHGITISDAYDIFDAFIADGHTMWDIVPVLLACFKAAGFLPKEADEDESKN